MLAATRRLSAEDDEAAEQFIHAVHETDAGAVERAL